MNSYTVDENQFILLDCSLFKSVNTSILQSVAILRLGDVSISRVSYPGNSSSFQSKTSQIKSFLPTSATDNIRIHMEVPVDNNNNNNIFIGSDKLLHNLPDTSSFLTVELRNHYHVDTLNSGGLNRCKLFFFSISFKNSISMYYCFTNVNYFSIR
ncbi:unnamed protein product [Heterobilharzia americana]|nr:unnamed protein product [Heterobilharzia americana]